MAPRTEARTANAAEFPGGAEYRGDPGSELGAELGIEFDTELGTESLGEFPDITRPDAGVALVSTRHAGSPQAQRAAARATLAARRALPWPDGLLSFSFYTGTDGAAVMAYAQWTHRGASLRHAAAHGPVMIRGVGESDDDLARSEPLVFRRYRTIGPGRSSTAVPACIATPLFDVDGPERQRTIIDTLLAGPLARPLPGLVAAHFHFSTCGTRILNYAEWTSEELHERSLHSATLQEAGATTRATPGVRGVGCPRYRLAWSLAAPGAERPARTPE
ncbi:antibiotic biosynthesis monooxygenase [Streptomyces klenkii]